MFQVTLLVTMCIIFSCIQPNYVYGAKTVIRTVNKSKVPTKKKTPAVPETRHAIYVGGIAVDSLNYVYISSFGELTKFSPTGKVVKTWHKLGGKDFGFLGGIAIDKKNNTYIIDNGMFKNSSRLIKMNSTGECCLQFSLDGGDTGYVSPFAVALDLNGNIYISGGPEASIKKYNPSGRLVLSWNVVTDEQNRRGFPQYLAVDSQGRIYVADIWASCVHQYNTDGSLIKDIADLGKRTKVYKWNVGVCVDGKDYIYIPEIQSKSISKYNSDGDVLASWVISRTPYLGAIAIDVQGNLYTTDCPSVIFDGFYLIKLDPNGKELQRWDVKL